VLSCSAKCFLTLVKCCGDNRVRLRFRNYTTIFTLYVDRVDRTYASLFRELVLCNVFQLTVSALSFLQIILLTPNTVAFQIPERFWEASLVQVVYKNATTVAFHSVEYNKYFSNTLRDFAFALSAVYVNQSLKNWTRSKSYMCTSFVNLLRVSGSPSYHPHVQSGPASHFNRPEKTFCH